MKSRQSDKSDDVFRLFLASCPPTSFLSSVLTMPTVFPTYTLCCMCNTHTVAHTHRLQCSAHRHCSSFGFFFCLDRSISHITTTHHTKLPETRHRAIADRSLRHISTFPPLSTLTAPLALAFTHRGALGALRLSSEWTEVGTRVFCPRQKQRWETNLRPG